MKDYSWLAVFSVFTLVVGVIFTYGNTTQADVDTPPVQVFVTSTTTPSSPIILHEQGGSSAPPSITVNVMIATSSLVATPQVAVAAADTEKPSSRTYYVTNNTYVPQETQTASTTEEVETITLSVEGMYDAATEIVAGETLLELLVRLDAGDVELGLTTQDYGDMGVLVTGMGGRINGADGNYWQYQVNGATPMVGADTYELQDGDVILWQFKGL